MSQEILVANGDKVQTVTVAALGLGGHVIGDEGYWHFDTTDEAWELEWPDNPHPYSAAAFFALRGLGVGPGGPDQESCLTVGSTVFEARMLRGHRWLVTMLDVRRPPADDVWFVKGDATKISFYDGIFGALSSTCCLCHAGLGRYGDRMVECGDVLALREFHRVLKPGGKASVMFGPCLPNLKTTVCLGRVHRIYAVKDVEQMAAEVGFRIDTAGLWCSQLRRWLTPEEVKERRGQKVDPETVLPYCYLAMLMVKE